MWVEGLATFAHALGEACKECDASHARARADAAEWEFSAQVRASGSKSKQLINLGRMLEERKILLCLQETDLEVQEAILAQEQEHGLCPIDRQTYHRN
jgi:coenzyme F420-reducing hydrogenase alpha subunit